MNAEEKKKRPPALSRKPAPKKEREPNRMIAWDLETTRIQAGTPIPKYLTAYSENPSFICASPVDDMAHLLELLRNRFLVPHLHGVKFVAWNANHFDSYFAAAALLHTDEFVMRPYLTRGKTLRGMKVYRKGQPDDTKEFWEFLDGIAMTGLQGMKLSVFTEKFSPQRSKQTGIVDFEGGEEFDVFNVKHREYALEDSVSLYYAMVNVEKILLERFNTRLGATMGGACIKIFKANIPKKTVVFDCGDDCNEIIRGYVMRGGYCFCARKFKGPVWKYDINQAYAAAMREARLPAGNVFHSAAIHPVAMTFIVRIKAENPKNKIPFYCKTLYRGKVRAIFAEKIIPETWVTSIEFDQLRREGWSITIYECYFWDDYFSMTDFVNQLEAARFAAEGGPNGPEGTVIKAVGNHSYGKTVEQLDPKELVLAKTCPDGFSEFLPEESDYIFSHVWQREKENKPRDYHKPQIGAFITAHVRMVVRRAALSDADSWIYADTDCVVFSRDVAPLFDIDARRYGAFKIEATGAHYIVVAKKVYAELDFNPKDDKAIRHAKGLNVKYLTPEDFRVWYEGTPPEQKQIHRNNFVKVMSGEEMYTQRKRKGTAV